MEPGYGPPGGFGHPDGFGIVFALLHMALWLGALLLLAWILWRWLGPRLRHQAAPLFMRAPADQSPIERLRLRFAAGEIDALTFEQMRERLQASYQPGHPTNATNPLHRPYEPREGVEEV